MCAKYSAEWWQRVAQASSELVQRKQTTTGRDDTVKDHKNENRHERSIQANEFPAASPER